MARHKRLSNILAEAEKRLVGMKVIDPKLDLGGGCSAITVEKQVNVVRSKLRNYHALLGQADAAASELEEAEKALSELSKKVLKGVAVRYNEESEEYGLVGGVRPSQRKRYSRSSAKKPVAGPSMV
ncbi:MAG: hypothetical protein AAFY72_17755 [Cyanobacteria bacterium J06649_4]